LGEMDHPARLPAKLAGPSDHRYGGPMIQPHPWREIAMTYGRAVVLGACVVLFMLGVLLMLVANPAMAADAPAPKEGHWVVRDFRFHTGEVLPEVRLHYTTIGAPSGEPALILHGTTGSGAGLLTPAFGG